LSNSKTALACTDCGGRLGRPGLRCSPCGSKHWYATNKDLNCAKTALWRKNNPEKDKSSQKRKRRSVNYRFSYSAQAAERRKLDWNISKEDYVWLASLPCFYCAVDFSPTTSGVGLDRLDNSKGYTLSNVVACCGACNFIRGNNLTVEEMQVVSETLKHFRALKKSFLINPVIF